MSPKFTVRPQIDRSAQTTLEYLLIVLMALMVFLLAKGVLSGALSAWTSAISTRLEERIFSPGNLHRLPF